VACRVWERLGSQTVNLDLKVGSWYEACAQAFAKGPMNVLFLFPGRRDLRALQQAGLREPPTGTIFAELGEKFVGFVDVLTEVSERTSCSSNADLLRLYEKWLKTGSRRSGQLLVERGVVPNVSIKTTRVQ